jgi:hypothetical protein
VFPYSWFFCWPSTGHRRIVDNAGAHDGTGGVSSDDRWSRSSNLVVTVSDVDLAPWTAWQDFIVATR